MQERNGLGVARSAGARTRSRARRSRLGCSSDSPWSPGPGRTPTPPCREGDRRRAAAAKALTQRACFRVDPSQCLPRAQGRRRFGCGAATLLGLLSAAVGRIRVWPARCIGGRRLVFPAATAARQPSADRAPVGDSMSCSPAGLEQSCRTDCLVCCLILIAKAMLGFGFHSLT